MAFDYVIEPPYFYVHEVFHIKAFEYTTEWLNNKLSENLELISVVYNTNHNEVIVTFRNKYKTVVSKD